MSGEFSTTGAQRVPVLPYPLAPADCDLRDFPHMQLDVQRLRDSRFASHSTGDGFRAGVLLWSASWHQIPAGSVPDDDIELAQLTGYGRVTSEFAKVKKEALHGFVLCSDGRWYHTVVAQKACAAWDAKLGHAFKKLDDRLRKENKKRAEEGREAVPVPTIEQWKAENFPLTSAFDARENQSSSAADREPPGSFPPESAGIPAETGSHGGAGDPEFQRKRLLKGEGEGEGEGEGYLNPPLPPKGGGRRPTIDPDEEPEGFAPWYALYRRKDAKRDAIKAWRQLAPDQVLQARLIAALVAWRWSDDRTKNPLPASWIRGRRWEDEAVSLSTAVVGVPVWCSSAGFANVFEAANAGCWEHTAAMFRDGRRQVEGVPA